MKDIFFKANYGDGDIKEVRISCPGDWGPRDFNVFIDGRYVARIIRTDTGIYRCFESKLDVDDLQAVVDRITEVKGEGFQRVDICTINHWPWGMSGQPLVEDPQLHLNIYYGKP